MSLDTTKDKKLAALNARIVGLRSPELYAYRKANGYVPVPGEGSSNARVMFVGEAPGKNEALTGRPFVGAAGKQLDALLGLIQLARENVFITSVVKDRPPNNRDPLPEEIAMHGPLLIEQIEIIQPRVVATLGRFSLEYLLTHYGALQAGQTITKLHGKAVRVRASFGELVLFPLYHPAAALYNPSLKAFMQADFKALSGILGK